MLRIHVGWMCRCLGVVLLLVVACGVPEETVSTSRDLIDGWSIWYVNHQIGGDT